MVELDIVNKDRSKFAQICNYRKMPVVMFDIGLPRDPFYHSVGGVKVAYKWEHDGKTAFDGARMTYYQGNERHPASLTISGETTCLHKDVTYHDVMETLDRNAAPVLERGEEFCMVVLDRANGKIFGVVIMKMDARLNKFCTEPVQVDKDDEKAFCERFKELFAAYIEAQRK